MMVFLWFLTWWLKWKKNLIWFYSGSTRKHIFVSFLLRQLCYSHFFKILSYNENDHIIHTHPYIYINKHLKKRCRTASATQLQPQSPNSKKVPDLLTQDMTKSANHSPPNKNPNGIKMQQCTYFSQEPYYSPITGQLTRQEVLILVNCSQSKITIW